MAAKRVSGFLKGLGVKTRIRRVGGAPYPRGNVVVIGTVVTNPWLKELADRELSASSGREGFLIKYLEKNGGVLALVGADRLGVLYATDELFGRVRRLEDLKRLDVVDRPYFSLRAYKMVLPLEDEFIIKRRINAIYLPCWLPAGVGFTGQYAGLRLMEEMVGNRIKDRSLIEWVAWKWGKQVRGRFENLLAGDLDEQYEAYRRRLREVREIGVKVFLSRYEWAFPLKTLAQNYYCEECVKTSRKGRPVLCLSSPRSQELIRRTYEKTLELFPELSGFVVYLSGEGGVGRVCECSECKASFKAFKEQLTPKFLIPGRYADAEMLYAHKRAFDLIYDAAKSARSDLEIVRNTWDYGAFRAPYVTEYAHKYTPADVIFQPYTTSTDTNLREPPSPQTAWWARHGRRVAPKMCQLMELQPRTNCFPNALDDRLRQFYIEWARLGVHGMCLHGGWFPSERFGGYKHMMENIGFGFNLYVHWKLLWNPFREDVEVLWNEWTQEVYGVKSAEAAKRCLKRAGQIYRLGPKTRVKRNPCYEDYLSYFSRWLHYLFAMDNVLLHNKFVHYYLGRPEGLHESFVKHYEELPVFRRLLGKAYKLLDQNIGDLERALVENAGNPKVAALLEWFKVEKKYLQGIEQLFRGEEEYRIKGKKRRSTQSYAKAYELLREALSRWGEIALEQRVWPLFMGGVFHPLSERRLDDKEWLDSGSFGVFFTWLRARADDPYGPDRINEVELDLGSFHRGLREFHWPMR